VVLETENEFPARLKRLRELRNWTQEQLADAMGVSKAAVRLYEGGGAEPRWIAVSRLLQETGAPYWTFTNADVDWNEVKRAMLQKQIDDLLLGPSRETPVPHNTRGNGAHKSPEGETKSGGKEAETGIVWDRAGFGRALAGVGA
jgi:transcriptional regulator with XRE-family HTH domain